MKVSLKVFEANNVNIVKISTSEFNSYVSIKLQSFELLIIKIPRSFLKFILARRYSTEMNRIL